MKSEILEAAAHCVNGDRDEQYGKPENSFLTIARLWSDYLNASDVNDGVTIVIKAHDVAAMLALMKIARIASGIYKADNWVDLAGYAACGGECESPNKDTVDKCRGCQFRDSFYSCTLSNCVKDECAET